MIRDVKEIEESTLWEDTGKQLANKGKNTVTTDLRRVVVVLGDRFSGKSSLIKTIRNDFDPQTKPNTLVQYWPSKFGKEKRELLHFYQIGSKELTKFLTIFKAGKVKITCLICIDLSKGNKLIQVATNYLSLIRQLWGKGESSTQAQIRQSHEDTELLTSLPVQVSLVGCKFDLFQKLDLQSRKWISRSLRYIAHTNCCSVFTCSNKNNQLGLTLRSSFSDYLNDGPSSNFKNAKDVNKPIIVRFGEDRVGDMNLPSSGSLSNIEVLTKQLETVNSKSDQKQENKSGFVDEGRGHGKLQDALTARRNELLKQLKKGLIAQSESKQVISFV